MACQTGQEIRDWSFSDEMGLLNSRGGLIASKWQHVNCKNCTSLALLSYAFSPKNRFLKNPQQRRCAAWHFCPSWQESPL